MLPTASVKRLTEVQRSFPVGQNLDVIIHPAVNLEITNFDK